MIFFSASHQIGLDTRSFLKWGTLCLSSAHLVQCESDDPAGLGLTRCNASLAHMPVYSLNLTSYSSSMLCHQCSSST